MAVNLQKGQKVSLTKDNSNLNSVLIGLGWDQVQKAKSGFFAKKPADIDCDASAILLQDGKLRNSKDLVYFGNLRHNSGCMKHMGDNLTGAGDGDDEQLMLELSSVPAEFDRIVIVVNIYQAVKRQQHFGMIENAFCRLIDMNTNQELCRYNLTNDYDDMTALILGEIYRQNGEWKFNAIGEGTKDAGLDSLTRRFQ